MKMKKFTELLKASEGSMSVQFVFCVPILMGLAVMSAELGKTLKLKHVLERSVRDATRYMSRAPQDSSGNFYQIDLDNAIALIEKRLPVPDDKKSVVISTLETVWPADTTEDLRTPFRILTIRAGVEVPTGMLKILYFFNLSNAQRDLGIINIAAKEETRYYGD